MLKYIGKKVLIAIATVFVLATATFFLMKLIPGDPYSEGQFLKLPLPSTDNPAIFLETEHIKYQRKDQLPLQKVMKSNQALQTLGRLP